MRRLILFRHAKAERPGPGMDDRDRALEPRGRHDAKVIGGYLVHHGFAPDLVVLSPSHRTLETWEHARTAFARLPKTIEDARLYDASPQTILDVIRDTSAAAHSVMLIGHNPGLHDVARLLIASGDIEHREKLNEDFPTSALAVIDFALDDWRKVHPDGGRLERFVSPKLLATATD
jgi:phosphohistidine phosphatase